MSEGAAVEEIVALLCILTDDVGRLARLDAFAKRVRLVEPSDAFNFIYDCSRDSILKV